MKTFTVHLEVPTIVWAVVQVEAETEGQAEMKARELATDGMVSFSDGQWDASDAECVGVEPRDALANAQVVE